MKKNLLFPFALIFSLNHLSAQVTQISNNSDLVLGLPVSATKAVFVQQISYKLWTTDGTLANTAELAVPVTLDENGGFIPFNNKMYFSGSSTSGTELWVTDGTVAGTSLVKDINTGTDSSSPKEMEVYNGAIYFFAFTPANGFELWKSDGTDAGTIMVKDINAGPAGSYSPDMEFMVYNNELYFSASVGNDLELWKTNGTSAGTVLVKDINLGPNPSTPSFLRVFNGELFFTAEDGSHGRELWKTNGTGTGTVLVKDIFTGPDESLIDDVIEFGGKLLFAASAATGDKELYQSDGTLAGTGILKDINTGPLGSNPDLSNAIIINNKLFFAAETLATGRELFMTDGTTGGTGLFMDLQSGVIGSNPEIWLNNNFFAGGFSSNQLLYNGQIFFQTSALIGGIPSNQLWVTDGTLPNTTMLKDFGLFGLIGSYFYTQSGLYFSGHETMKGLEVFKTTGTIASTTLYADVNPGEESSLPFFQFFILNGKVFFIAEDGDSPSGRRDLFVLSGNETALPINLVSFAAAAITEGVNLTWATSNENGSKEFELQRSMDGNSFYPIGTVRASGNSNSRNNYQYLDKDAYQKNSQNLYYRLKIVDDNLKFTYSQVALIQLPNQLKKGLLVSPVPAREFLRINYLSSTNQQAQIRVINIKGQVIHTISTRLFAGNNQQVVNIEKLAPGIYYTQLVIEGRQIAISRFIKN